MELQVKGKHMDTTPLRGLIRQGENQVDSLRISLPRYYGSIDLSTLFWALAAQDASGHTAQQLLQIETPEVDTLTLLWKVGDPFTRLRGDVRLELNGMSASGEESIKIGADTIYIIPGIVAGQEAPEAFFEELSIRLRILEGLLTTAGEGNRYLADDGQYKPVLGVSPARYRKRFAAEDFIPRLARHQLLIPPDEHGLGTAVIVMECRRERESGYENILYQYQTLPNGGILVLTDESFAGEIIIEGI